MDEKRVGELKSRIEKHPENILDRFALAKIYFDEEHWSEAVEELKQLIAIKKDYMVCYLLLGESLIALNRKDEARKFLETGRELAIVQKHQGPLEEMEALLEELN